jgi:hypothetical protein
MCGFVDLCRIKTYGKEGDMITFTTFDPECIICYSYDKEDDHVFVDIYDHDGCCLLWYELTADELDQLQDFINEVKRES